MPTIAAQVLDLVSALVIPTMAMISVVASVRLVVVLVYSASVVLPPVWLLGVFFACITDHLLALRSVVVPETCLICPK